MYSCHDAADEGEIYRCGQSLMIEEGEVGMVGVVYFYKNLYP